MPGCETGGRPCPSRPIRCPRSPFRGRFPSHRHDAGWCSVTGGVGRGATDGAAFVVRPSHVDDQHRGDFHREDHLRALLGHDSCFQSGRWEGGVPWLLFLLLLRLVLLGGCHCGIFWE